jgi:hypothetical protein
MLVFANLFDSFLSKREINNISNVGNLKNTINESKVDILSRKWRKTSINKTGLTFQNISN